MRDLDYIRTYAKAQVQIQEISLDAHAIDLLEHVPSLIREALRSAGRRQAYMDIVHQLEDPEIKSLAREIAAKVNAAAAQLPDPEPPASSLNRALSVGLQGYRDELAGGLEVRLAGELELRVRDYLSQKFTTALLSVDKWRATHGHASGSSVEQELADLWKAITGEELKL